MQEVKQEKKNKKYCVCMWKKEKWTYNHHKMSKRMKKCKKER